MDMRFRAATVSLEGLVNYLISGTPNRYNYKILEVIKTVAENAK